MGFWSVLEVWGRIVGHWGFVSGPLGFKERRIKGFMGFRALGKAQFVPSKNGSLARALGLGIRFSISENLRARL